MKNIEKGIIFFLITLILLVGIGYAYLIFMRSNLTPLPNNEIIPNDKQKKEQPVEPKQPTSQPSQKKEESKKSNLPKRNILWGAYVGDVLSSLASFEKMVGKKTNMVADFEAWDADFPTRFSKVAGEAGKTLIVFWEPNFGYDNINDGSKDLYIQSFAKGAKDYGYPVILSPFDEMNLNETPWGYGANNNNSEKFIAAWKRVYEIFKREGATNVKFAIDFNNVSIPDVPGNKYSDYYPGGNYVDYIGISGFNFGDPWQSFCEIFDNAVKELSAFKKPIYILSTGTVPGTQKAAWIIGMGDCVKKYSNVLGWVWFNSNSDRNWLVNTDSESLSAFKKIIPN